MRSLTLAVFLTAAIATPGKAAVLAKSDIGFAVGGSTTVTATPGQTWRRLVTPARWWSKDHTWSHDASNLSIDPRPGGCFCEVMPAKGGAARGGVEHMRVIYAQPGKMLRMTGALGPLQSEAVQGTLTVKLEPVSGGTRIEWNYVVGGYMRYKTEGIAPAVDGVLGQQFGALASGLGIYQPG